MFESHVVNSCGEFTVITSDQPLWWQNYHSKFATGKEKSCRKLTTGSCPCGKFFPYRNCTGRKIAMKGKLTVMFESHVVNSCGEFAVIISDQPMWWQNYHSKFATGKFSTCRKLPTGSCPCGKFFPYRNCTGRKIAMKGKSTVIFESHVVNSCGEFTVIISDQPMWWQNYHSKFATGKFSTCRKLPTGSCPCGKSFPCTTKKKTSLIENTYI